MRFHLFRFLLRDGFINLTLLRSFIKYRIYNLNNTRLASAGFGRKSAPRWVTFSRGLSDEIH
ncbi:hypothetical protein BMS3Abin06_00291 [bacterium BMS3Abin06]|nr:hypothetical protein BMS3Abin06_00291 [bacterium BMS3Abin06]